MTQSKSVDYCLLRYVPNMLSEKSASIAAIFVTSGDLENGICTMVCAPDWETTVLDLDPDVDLEMLNALLTEIRDRLLSARQRSEVIRQLEDSFSNAIQVSERRKCPGVLSPEAVEAFARSLLRETSKMQKMRHTLSRVCAATR